MSRPNKPWYWKARDGWYAKIDGTRFLLAKGKANKKLAEAEFYKLMADPEKREIPSESVAAVLDDFLDWTQENRATKTYECYRGFCQDFLDEYGNLLVSELSTEHVTAWLRKKKTWNNTTKRDAITCIQRVFNWARKNRGLKHNPIAGMEKPTPNNRTVTLTNEAYEALLDAIPDQEFKDLLIVSWECGCRPQEVKAMEARHIDLKRSRWVLPTEEGKGRKIRVIYMTDSAQEIIARRMEQYPEGPIFRNTRGKPWTGYAVKCRFEKLEERLAHQEMKKQKKRSTVTDEAIEALVLKLDKYKTKRTGEKVEKKSWELRAEAKRKLQLKEAKQYNKRYRQYDLRHSYITRKLVAGVDSHIVAALSGHSDTSMIDRVYSHVADDHEFMLKQARTVPHSKEK